MLDTSQFYARQHVNRLEADAIIDRAIAQTGLGDMVDPGLRGRVTDIVGRINARGLVNRANAMGAELEVTGRLVSRLQFEKTQRDLPEICSEAVRRPIVVVGYARTGSTILHALLAADPDGHAAQAWEAFYPSPPPGISTDISARVGAAGRDVLELLARVPGLGFHPYFDRLGHSIVECDEIFSLDFQNGIVSQYAQAPVAMLDTTMKDPQSGYAFHKRMLQQLQWKRDFGHWVLKGTRHQTYLKQLFDTYPDAICVYAHRNPNETVGSVLGSAELFIKGYEGECDRMELGRHTPEGIAAIYDAVVDDPMIVDPRVIHVRFQDFIGDHVGTLRGIYEKAGLDFTPAYETAIRAWLADPANRSDRYGKFTYALEDYGVDAEALRPKFARYVERFELLRA
jgi:hypothetical protein